MKHDIDTLVADICASHPELAGDVSAVRALVTELIDRQPTVSIDATFKANLRARLLATAPRPTTPKLAVPWWFIYTVPVGVTALLLLVIAPNLATAPQPTTIPNSIAPEADSSLKIAPDDAGTRTMLNTTMDADTMATESVSTTVDFFTATFADSNHTLTISYLSLSQPGFVVLTGPEGVVATSELLLPGEYTEHTVPITLPLTPGTTYTATLHYDNGDDVFTPDFDFPALNQFGEPVNMPLVAL